MRIVVASTYVPFVRGGTNRIIDDLEGALRGAGHQVDSVRIPLCSSCWREIPEQALAIRLLDLTESCGNKIDLLLTIRYPSYALWHPNKVVWFIHHHRGAYDLWDTPYGDIPHTAEGVRVRDGIVRADNTYLREAERVFANSQVVADRLLTFNNVEVDDVLYPPLLRAEHFHAGDFGDYFVYPSRLTPIKRQALAIEAMRHVRSPFRLILAGAGDLDRYADDLQSLVHKYNLEGRVVLTNWIEEQEKADLLAGSCGVLYLPYDEDSYGYVTLEAFHSHKPVLTFSDSGGTNEVIQDEFNGRVVDPTPQALAEAMEWVWADKVRARELGENAHATLRLHKIHWDHIIESLVA
jgi:glycosyltransferase involved in cell wall biosynthesis